MNDLPPSPPSIHPPKDAKSKWITMQVTVLRAEYDETANELKEISEHTVFKLSVAKLTAKIFRLHRKTEVLRLRKSSGLSDTPND